MPEEEQYASREEIEGALTSLTTAQRLRLKKFADYRARSAGRVARGGGDDLLQEAVTATLIGCEAGGEGRRWRKRVDIVKHLVEAMRSIASHWRESRMRAETSESELISVDGDGVAHGPFDNLADPAPDALRVAQARGELARVLGMFKGDDNAVLVLEGLREGWKREDFADIGMSLSDYDAAIKRVHYRLRNEP